MDEFNPYRTWLDLPEGEWPPDHYRLLKLARFSGDAQAIGVAADAALARVRSFRPGPNVAAWSRLLDEIQQARACLLDGGQKSSYDAQLRSRFGSEESTKSSGAPTPATSIDRNSMWPPGMGPPSAAKAPEPAPTLAAIPPSSAPTLAPATVPSLTPAVPTLTPATAIPTLAPANPAPLAAAMPSPMAPVSLAAAPAPYSPYATPSAPATPVNPMMPGSPYSQPSPLMQPGARDPMAPVATTLGSLPPAVPMAMPGAAPAAYAQPYAQPFAQPVAMAQPTAVPVASVIPVGGMSPYAAPVQGYPGAMAMPVAAVAQPVGAWGAASVATAIPTAMSPSYSPHGMPGMYAQPAGLPEAPGPSVARSVAMRRSSRLPTLVVSVLVCAALFGGAYYIVKHPPEPLAQAPSQNADGKLIAPPHGGHANSGKVDPSTAPVPTNPGGGSPPVPNPRPPEMDQPAVPDPAANTPPTPPEPTPMPEPTPPTPTPPARPAPTPEEEKKLQIAIKKVAAALADRNIPKAKKALDDVDGLSGPPEFSPQINAIHTMTEGVDFFWQSVSDGLDALKGGDEIEIGSTRVIVVSADKKSVTIRSGGKSKRYGVEDMPAGLALAMAKRHFAPNDKVTHLSLGAFLVLDREVVDRKKAFEQAQKYWDQAARGGIDIEPLKPFLDENFLAEDKGKKKK